MNTTEETINELIEEIIRLRALLQSGNLDQSSNGYRPGSDPS